GRWVALDEKARGGPVSRSGEAADPGDGRDAGDGGDGLEHAGLEPDGDLVLLHHRVGCEDGDAEGSLGAVARVALEHPEKALSHAARGAEEQEGEGGLDRDQDAAKGMAVVTRAPSDARLLEDVVEIRPRGAERGEKPEEQGGQDDEPAAVEENAEVDV